MPTRTESYARSRSSQISKDVVLDVFRQEACLDVRKLAGRLHVDSRDANLITAIDSLKRAGKLLRISGKGHHALFVLTTFET